MWSTNREPIKRKRVSSVTNLLYTISILLISSGLFFFLIGTIGVLRFKDALTRVHGAAKCDTLGAVLTLSGLMLIYGWSFTSLKLLLVIFFLWSTGPTGTHVLGKAIMNATGKGHPIPQTDIKKEGNQ